MADSKITALTSYTPAIDTDVLPIVDVTTDTTKKITWANVKATLKTYFDTLYAGLVSPDFTTPDINTATADSLQAGSASSGLLMINNAGTTVASFGVGSASSTNIALSGAVALGANNITMTGSIGVTGSRVTKLWSTDIESTNAPTVGGVAVPTISSTNTLTNKRITKRTGTTTSSATPTINTDNVDFYSITAQTEAITSFTTNLSGTPTEGQTLWIAITGTAARGITWGASFEASTIALPTTTVTTNRLDVGFVWNTVTSKWRCVASA